jgi:hypothetical protein
MKVTELLEATDQYAELVTRLKTNCPKNLRALVQSDLPLLRGDSRMLGMSVTAEGHKFAWAQFPARKTARVSQTGNNLFLSWVSSAPQWKNVPKRAYSYFATLSYEDADNFGKVSLIVPFDTVTNYAAMPDDFNLLEIGDGRYDLMTLAETFSATVRDAYQARERTSDIELSAIVNLPGTDVDIDGGRLSPKDFKHLDQLFSQLIAFDKSSDLLAKSDRLRSLHSDVQELRDVLGDQSFLSWLQDNVSPADLNVSTFSSLTAIAASQPPPKSEIWFEGPYISIRCDSLNADDLYTDGFMKKLVKDILG